MRLENRGGDVLARGGARAQFQGPKVSQEKWNSIFDEYVPDSEKQKDEEKDSKE